MQYLHGLRYDDDDDAAHLGSASNDSGNSGKAATNSPTNLKRGAPYPTRDLEWLCYKLFRANVSSGRLLHSRGADRSGHSAPEFQLRSCSNPTGMDNISRARSKLTSPLCGLSLYGLFEAVTIIRTDFSWPIKRLIWLNFSWPGFDHGFVLVF